MTLDILLWTFLASFAIHLVDETTMNGGFVSWMKRSFWPTYTARMNFWFNSVAVLLIAIAILLTELVGGHWIIFVLVWPVGFALHGFTVHLFWTIKQKNVCPGLATSVIYWIMGWFFVRYGLLAGQISAQDFWIGVALGVVTVGAFLTFVPPLIAPAVTKKARGRRRGTRRRR